MKFLIFIACISLSFLLIGQNNSLHFDGLNDRVELGSASYTFNSSGALTVEAWINSDNWKAQAWQGTIVGKDQGNNSGYVLRCGSSGRLSFTVGTGSGWTEVLSAPLMQTNSWYHVAGVMDNGTLKIYIDGTLVGSKNSALIANSTSRLYIGESSGFSGRVFDGKIDEVRIWDTVRTQTEIQQNDTANLASNTPHLLGYYKMDQITGNSAPNTVATPNTNGTLINFSGNYWTSGFAPTTTDISVTALNSPDQISFFKGRSKVKMTVKNTGIDTLNSFQLSYKVNSHPPVTDSVNHLLLPGETYTHLFDQIVVQSDSMNNIWLIAKTNGDVNANNDSLLTYYEKPFPINWNVIHIFKRKQHNFAAAGQSNLATVSLPENNHEYRRIYMSIDLDCPSSGCDPWDQPAKISLLKDGVSYELARFITPYGKGCGPFVVDVTDFRNLLRGSCDFSSYIQVWGSSGWLLNVWLTYVEGNEAEPYNRLSQLWATDNWVYGEPTVSYDLPAMAVRVDSNTTSAHLRMTITGHGQGNTNNAAEFSNFTHTVVANNSNVNQHNLWKSNCAVNNCSNQAGTWQFNRAGWCPGQAVSPYIVSMDTSIRTGQNLIVDYVLQPYTNLLNTGYNGGSHTQPHYKIHAYLVQQSAQYIDSVPMVDLAALAISSPQLGGIINALSPVKVLLKNWGSDPINNARIMLFDHDSLVASEVVSATINPSDTLEYTFNFLPGFNSNTDYDLSVVLSAPNDEASSNDFAALFIAGSSVGIKEIDRTDKVQIYPNPSSNLLYLEGELNKDQSYELVIYNIQGKRVMQRDLYISGGKLKVEHQLENGIYLLELKLTDGIIRKSIVVLR